MDLVEQIGSGIKRIMQLCKDYGVQTPEVFVEDNWITVIFEQEQNNSPLAKDGIAEQDTEQDTEQVKTLLQAVLPN